MKISIWFLLAFAVLAGSYFLLVHNRKYEKIAKTFINETARHDRGKLVVMWLYIIVTLVLFFGLISIQNS